VGEAYAWGGGRWWDWGKREGASRGRVAVAPRSSKRKIADPFFLHFILLSFTRFVPVRCYGHPIIYNAIHKTYNKNYIIRHFISHYKTSSYLKNNLKLSIHLYV
jgi:hypothetical protein